MTVIQNSFGKGLVTDSLDSLSPNDTYSLALNAIHESREHSGFGLVNEESNELAASFGGTIKGKTHIDERNETLFFVYSGSSDLWLFNHNTNKTTFVCSDSEFGCNWGFDKCEFLYGEFKKFNACNELHVYWSSDCIYHVVNIDEMLDSARKAAVAACEDCSYFDIFKAACGPHLSAFSTQNSGSTAEAGAVQFAIQLEDQDGNRTNVFDISQPAYLKGPNNIAGEASQSSARLTVDALDPKYDRAIIYVIKTTGGVTTIDKMPARTYSDKGFTFEYYGQKGELVDVSVLVNKSKAFLRGQDLIQKDGRLFYYSIKNERNLNYQKYANSIRVEWVEYEVALEQQEKYHFPSLMRGEVYAIGIVWRYLDGTYSPAFHIPACGGGGGGGGGGFAARARSNSAGEECFDFDGNPVSCDSEEVRERRPGGGGEGPGQSGAASDIYNPVKPEDFDTEDQLKRERNPDEVKDRPNESDFLEEFTLEDVQAIDTDRDDMVESGACHDNLYGCAEAEEAMDADIDDMSNTIENNAELLARYGRDYPDPELKQTDNIKDAGIYLIENAVIEREYLTFKFPELNYSGSSSGGPGGSPEEPEGDTGEEPITFSQGGVGVNTFRGPAGGGKTNRGDNWVDSLGNILTEEPPRVVGSGGTQPYNSTVPYPDDKDCDGARFYPGGNVCHHRIPWSSERPHFVSFQNGVVNQYQSENYEFGKTYVRPMGLRLSNVQRPSDDELPKPLCPNSPFKVVYVKRTDQNKSVFAKGFVTGMFQGESFGATYLYPRHGVNSFETVDRMVNTDGGLGKKGSHYDGGACNFHSPDTDCDNSYLPVDKVKAEGQLRGSGWRHGLYAKGQKPKGNQFTGTRKDQRGARVSNNVNHFLPGGGMMNISGLTYAPGDSVVSPASGMSQPLMNRFRESSVYMEVGGSLPGLDRDKSFVGDVMDHFCPTEANAGYAALVRDMPDQYGGVESLQYIDLGINATQVHVGGGGTVEGLCGDTFIGPYAKRRTSYVSNKQGDFFHPPPKPGSPCRERSWCDSADDKIFQYFGIDHYPTKIPKSGDLWDPKNYAGLHTVGGGCGEYGHSKNCMEAAGAGDSESEFYWPRTLTGLVTTVVESHVNPWLRETGKGSQLEGGMVWYPRGMKDLALDSAASLGEAWEHCWLNRFYCAVEQPSKAQIAKKTLVRTLMNMIAPAYMLNEFQDMQGIVDVVSSFFVFPMLAAFWILATNTLFTDRRLDQLLGISPGLMEFCLRDEEGGLLDEEIENWEDNYCKYNWDYSKVNDVQPYYAFPLPYNTCDCDSCSKSDLNNEIYHSNKQNLDSEIDAYREVLLNNYLELPGHAGDLRRLFKQNNGFYAHTTDGIWALKLGPVTAPSDIASQQSGTGELFAEPQLIFEGPEEGFMGTDHPNAAINTAFGYFFVDDVAKKIYRFTGQVEEISNYGMYHFFKENLGFCNPKGCVDEKVSGGIHYSLGWDPRHNRLLVTKHDGEACSSWTLSYTPLGLPTQGGGARGKWISFHSYIPQDYLWDRNNFYSILSKGEVWKHHKKDSYQTYYGDTHPFMVQFNANAETFYQFDFKELILDTEAYGQKRYHRRDMDDTFTSLAVWNSTQGTGTLPLDKISDNEGAITSQLDRGTHDPSKVRLKKQRRMWRTNELHDLVIADCPTGAPMMTIDCECDAIPEVNEDIFNCEVLSKQDMKGRILADTYLTYRFMLTHRNDMRLYFKKLLTLANEKKYTNAP